MSVKPVAATRLVVAMSDNASPEIESKVAVRCEGVPAAIVFSAAIYPSDPVNAAPFRAFATASSFGVVPIGNPLEKSICLRSSTSTLFGIRS